jgi:type I restriction enzyme S subunit
MSFPRYPTYKPSGVEWLGEVPEHWGIGQSRRRFLLRNERAIDGEEQLTASQKYGIVKQAEFVESEGRRVVEVIKGADILKHVESGDFVISMRSFQGGIEYSPLSGCISSAYVMLTPVKDVCPAFFRWLLKSDLYIQALQSTSNLVRDGQALRFSNFSQIDIPLIPLFEQEIVATFLDHETAKIDALIAEQQRQIELLQEKRQAVISHAVTKGLNPDAPMKDSGVEWLGEVPEHWSMRRVKHLCASIEQGWSPQCENESSDGNTPGVLKVGCVNGGVFRPSENKKLPPDLSPIPEYSVRSGDLLVSRANTRELVGSTAVVSEDFPWLYICDKLYRITISPDKITANYLALFLASNEARGQIELGASGASQSMQNISQSVLMDLPIPLPHLKEQESIRNTIAIQCGQIGELTAKASEAILLLQERRSAVISAAVTGQIDVRGLVPEAEAA